MFNVIRFSYDPGYSPPPTSDPAVIELHEAASTGNTEACTALVKRNPKIINSLKREAGTPLHSAVAGGYLDGHVETINRLIELGANPEATYLEHTPLHLAVRMGRPNVVKALLEKKCDPEAYEDGGGNEGPLHDACYQKDRRVVQMLLQAGARIDRDDYEGAHPLHYAAAHDDPDLIRLLLDAGADPNMLADDRIRTPLHRAATGGKLRTVKALLSGGADPDGFRVTIPYWGSKPKINHYPPISFAIINDHCDVVSELVKSGADLKHPVKFRQALKEIVRELITRKEIARGRFWENREVNDDDSGTESNSDDDSNEDESLITMQNISHIRINCHNDAFIHGNYMQSMEISENIEGLEIIVEPEDVEEPEDIEEPEDVEEPEDMEEFEEEIGENFDHMLAPIFKKINNKMKEKFFGKFGIDPPEFRKPMEPIKYCVYTEKTKIIGALMMSGKYSEDDIYSLKILAKTHELTRSLQAIDEYSVFIPPESLQVLSGRAIKKKINNNYPDEEVNSKINQLDVPKHLRHFLQQPIEIGGLLDS